MFKSSQQQQARSAARLVFGGVLVVQAIRMIAHAIGIGTAPGPSVMADLIVQAWLVAFVAAVATRIGVQYLPVVGTPVARGRVFVASHVVLAVGAALVLPLTVHLVYELATDGTRGFDDWAVLSMLFAGVSHVVFATMLGFRAADLARGKARPLSIPVVYVASVAGGMVPLPIIPAALVAITGIPLLPLLFAMKPYIERERRDLTAANADFPAAVALAAA